MATPAQAKAYCFKITSYEFSANQANFHCQLTYILMFFDKHVKSSFKKIRSLEDHKQGKTMCMESMTEQSMFLEVYNFTVVLLVTELSSGPKRSLPPLPPIAPPFLPGIL